jgi:phosphatidylglycerol:prolipoprotein diacylglycerol transferase
VLFAVLWWLTHSRLALRKPGIVGGAFLAGYGLARSFCELFREPDPGHILTFGLFTAGILYSLPMILIGIWMMQRAGRRVATSSDAQR